MSVSTTPKIAAPRPDKSSEAVALRREAVRQSRHSCAMEGLTNVDPDAEWITQAVIDGNMSTTEARKAFLAHYSVK